MKATSVLLCHNFKSQEVFTDDIRPTSLTCSSSDGRVFLATKPCQVLVYTADQPPLTLLHRFPTVSNVSKIVYSEVGDYVATIESKETRNASSSARLYFNWSKCEDGKAASVAVAGYSSLEGVQDHFSQFFVVQLPIRYSVTCLGCCPLTGNVVVASEAKISIFRLRKIDAVIERNSASDEESSSCHYCDVEHVLDVEPRFPVRQVALCECYVAFRSSLEVRVIHLLFNGESKNYRSSWKEEVNTQQHEVIDKSFVCCTFGQFATLDSVDSTESSQDVSSANCQLLTLPSVAKEIPYLDNTGFPMQIFGPVDDVPGQPLNVRLEGLYSIGIPVDGVLPEVTARTMLYRRFMSEEMSNVGTEEDEIHTLQLLPAFAQDHGAVSSEPCNLLIPQLDHSLTLVSMCCFISGPKEGFLFDVLREAQLVSKYTYSADTVSVFMGKTLLYAITLQGMEVYTSRTYAVAAEWTKVLFEHKTEGAGLQTEDDHSTRSRSLSEGDTIDTTATFSELKHKSLSKENVQNLEHCSDQAQGTSSDEFHEGFLGEKMRQRLNCFSSKKKFTRDEEKKEVSQDYFVPVYPVEQLLKPCPSPTLENVLIGMQSFMGLFYVKCFRNYVLVLSQQRNHKSAAQADSQRIGTYSEWTIYILKNENMFQLHKNMIFLADQVVSCSLQTYHQLLCESYLQLSSKITVETLPKNRTSALTLLRECTTQLAEYYSKSGSSDSKRCLDYYKSSELSMEQIINRTFDQQGKKEALLFGNGLIYYLNHMLFTDDKKPISTSQDVANKILTVYGTTCPAKFSQLILNSNLDGYSYEMAINILQGLKVNYRFSSEDYLASAVLFLHICEPDQAKSSLASVLEGKLVSVCIKFSQLLHEDGKVLAPLGQLLRTHQSRVLIAILLHLHDNKKMCLTTALTLLGAYKPDVANNDHVRDFLEHILSNDQRKESFDESVKLLCRIYLKKLDEDESAQRRSLPKHPHHHIPKFEGHFAERFRWLNKLPPFLGGITAPERCPFLQRSTLSQATHLSIRHTRERAPSPSSSKKPGDKSMKLNSSECSCCCCHSNLIKLQSLVCSDLVSRSLCEYILSQVDQMSFSGILSIKLLCLPQVGQHHRAVQLVLDNYPTLILLFAKSFFKDDHKKWSCLLNALLDRLRDQEEDLQHDNYLKATHGTLKHLASCSSPVQFLQLLPSEGSLGFFLPYLEKCYRKWHSIPLSQQEATV